MTEEEITLRAFLAGVLTSKIMKAEGVKIVRARVEAQGEPPEIDLEIEGCILKIAVLSAERVGQQDGHQRCPGCTDLRCTDCDACPATGERLDR